MKSKVYFKCKFVQLHLTVVTLSVVYGSWTRNWKWLHALSIIQMPVYRYIIVFYVKKKTLILKLSSSLIIGLTEASFENSILWNATIFKLNLYLICKVEVVSKQEILSSLQNPNNPLICLIATSMHTLPHCNNLLTKFTAWALVFLSWCWGWS